MKQKLSNLKGNFLHRRYAARLGRRYVLAAAGVVLMGVLGCSQVNGDTKMTQSQKPGSESSISTNISNVDRRLVAANTKFGFKLFSQVIEQDQGKNVFVAPSSIAIALAMTYNGASDSTQTAMAKTLELQGLNLSEINSSNAALKMLLQNPDPKVQLNIANSLWANQDVTFNSDFLKRNRDFYQAKVETVNFQDTATSKLINGWIQENTQGKINKIVDKIPPDQMLYLINAIYFKGQWTNKFDQKQTKEYPFYLASGKSKQHPMMSQSDDYRYYENEEFQAVSLPYGKEGKISFYVFLPKKNSSLNDFYNRLNLDNWEKWMSQFRKREGFVRLPRFKMDYEINLNNSLTALGMGEAFSNAANFSGIGNKLKISEVKHKTFVEVNEEGTEAAAATSVGIVPTSAMPSLEPFRMIVDRPFFFAIQDERTGSLLFMGSMMEPQTKG